MGKVDDMRAMREARYAARQKMSEDLQKKYDNDPGLRKALKDAAESGTVKKERPPRREVTEELCGHRAIGGKTCTRPKDHAEKNHRYK